MSQTANQAVRWRTAIAQQVATLYAAHPKMDAVVIAGSVGAGWADRYSDVEIHAFWREAPTDDDRWQLAQRAGGSHIEIFPFEQDEWSDEYFLGQLQVGFSQFTVETIERYLTELVDRFNPAIEPQIQIAAIQRSIPVSGHDLIERWRARAATYPDGLRRAMVLEHIDFNHRWYGADMLAARDDAIMLYGIAHTVAAQVMGTLHGLNRMYVANPHYKWMDRTLDEMLIKPVGASDRLRHVFRSPPAEGVAALQAIAEDVLDLVALHLAEIDVEPFRQKVRRRRNIVDRLADIRRRA